MSITNTYIHSTATTLIFLASGEQAITTVFFCNNSSVTDTSLDIYLTPAASAVSSGTQIIKSLPLPKSETFVFDAEKLILATGDKIHAQATVNDIVVATVSSVQTS
jgi:hypothetical protein